MKLGITSKLFVAILATNIITAVAVGLGVRAAFNSGFESYLQEREDFRLGRLARVLASAYEEYHGWDFLRGNDELWVSLNHSVRPPRGAGPMPSSPRSAALAPPHGLDWRREPGLPPPAVVIDTAGHRVVGPAAIDADLSRRPIEVGNTIVGWLGAPPRLSVVDVVDQRFHEQQKWAGWLVALLATILSAIVAWLLARGLLLPVKRLAKATGRLADGDYKTRVESSRNDELGRLVDDFNRLGNALEKQESSRRNFMADVSHELRTPLAVLKGELEALQDGMRPLTPQTVQSLQAEVAILGKLVNDLHDLSLADVGGLAFRCGEMDLSKLAGDCLGAFRERFASRNLRVETQLREGVKVHADADRLAQIVNNLLENTVRYTDEGGRIVISLRAESGKAVLDLQDSAPGVPEESLPRIFERLYRVESSRNRERGGSGLGLSICRCVVEAHGGTIVARASSLGGLWIEVRLPLAKGAR
jgi:two-component system sensor histidine kinase BaeS